MISGLLSFFMYQMYSLCGLFTMETILAAAFGRQVNVLKGEANDLTRAAAGIFKALTGGKVGHIKFAALLSEHLFHYA